MSEPTWPEILERVAKLEGSCITTWPGRFYSIPPTGGLFFSFYALTNPAAYATELRGALERYVEARGAGWATCYNTECYEVVVTTQKGEFAQAGYEPTRLLALAMLEAFEGML